MSFRKILLSCASLSLLVSCDPRDFDALSDSTWVDSSGKPGDLTSAGYGAGLIGSSDGTGDLHYFVAAKQPSAVVLVKFNKAGSRSSSPALVLEGNETLPSPTIMASDPSGFNAANVPDAMGNVALAVIDTDGAPALSMLRPDTSAPVVNIPLTGDISSTGVAFGATDANPPEIDILAANGTSLNLVNDYKNYPTNNMVSTCSLSAISGGLILADVDVAAGSEYLVGVGNSVEVGQASQIEPNSGCPNLGTIAAPGGEASFGRTLQSGDFDGNGAADLAIAAPDENAVYVFLNWTVAVPTMGTKIANPEGSAAFGANIAVGDFDGDGSDELVISDHTRDADGVTAAGTVYIYSQSGGQFTAPIELHDASPESDQEFGQSLTVAKAFLGDSLVVGAKNEVFTYFRTPVDGDGDSRE